MAKRILFTLGLLFFALLFLHPINAGDFFHHLNTGRYILTHHQLPTNDEWSFTAYGKPWVAHSWGSGVIFYLIYQLFGYLGLSALFAVIAIATAIIFYKLLKKLQVSSTTTLITTCTAMAIASLRSPTRPEMFGPLFVVLLLYLLVRKTIWLLPIVFWLWSVLYGSSVILGMALLIFFIVLKRSWMQKNMLIVLFLSFLASLLNGYGLQTLLYVREIPTIAAHTTEWMPILATLDTKLPDLVMKYQADVLVYLLFLGFYLFLVIYARKRISWLWLLPSLGIFLPLSNIRFLSYAPYFTFPYLALLLSYQSPKAKRFWGFLLIALALTTLIVNLHKKDLGIGLSDQIFPTTAVSFLKMNKLAGKVFVHQELAAYITWELPESQIFIDTRDDLYQKLSLFDDLSLFYQGQGDLLDRYGVEIVLGELENPPPYQHLVYNPNWSLVYLADGYFVAVRTKIAQSLGLASFSAIDPWRNPGAKPGQYEKAQKQYIELLKTYPYSLENHLRLAAIKLALNQKQEAKSIVESLDLAKYLRNHSAFTTISIYELLAQIYLANQECTQAYRWLTEADRASRNQLWFSPQVRLANSVDRHLASFYLTCQKDPVKAREYLLRYLSTVVNPIERQEAERLLEQLRPLSSPPTNSP